MQRRVARGYDHGPFRDGVAISQGEGFGGEVGDKNDRGAVAEEFLDNGVGVGQARLEHGEVERLFGVAVAGGEVFFAEAGKHVGTLSEDLEQPGGRAAGGVLRGEEEGEEGLADFRVGELPDEVGRLFRVGLARRNSRAVAG